MDSEEEIERISERVNKGIEEVKEMIVEYLDKNQLTIQDGLLILYGLTRMFEYALIKESHGEISQDLLDTVANYIHRKVIINDSGK